MPTRAIRAGLVRWLQHRAKWTAFVAAVFFIVTFNAISPGWAVVLTVFYIAGDMLVWGVPAQWRARFTPVAVTSVMLMFLWMIWQHG